jgi:hypothetical protein
VLTVAVNRIEFVRKGIKNAAVWTTSRRRRRRLGRRRRRRASQCQQGTLAPPRRALGSSDGGMKDLVAVPV